MPFTQFSWVVVKMIFHSHRIGHCLELSRGGVYCWSSTNEQNEKKEKSFLKKDLRLWVCVCDAWAVIIISFFINVITHIWPGPDGRWTFDGHTGVCAFEQWTTCHSFQWFHHIYSWFNSHFHFRCRFIVFVEFSVELLWISNSNWSARARARLHHLFRWHRRRWRRRQMDLWATKYFVGRSNGPVPGQSDRKIYISIVSRKSRHNVMSSRFAIISTTSEYGLKKVFGTDGVRNGDAEITC